MVLFRDHQNTIFSMSSAFYPKIEIWGAPKVLTKNLFFFKIPINTCITPHKRLEYKHAQNCFWRPHYDPPTSIVSAFSPLRMTPNTVWVLLRSEWWCIKIAKANGWVYNDFWVMLKCFHSLNTQARVSSTNFEYPEHDQNRIFEGCHFLTDVLR